MGSAQTEHLGAYCLEGSKWGTSQDGARGTGLSPEGREDMAVAWKWAHFLTRLAPHLEVEKAQ